MASSFEIHRFTIPAASTSAIVINHTLGVTPVGAEFFAWGGGAAAGSGSLQTGDIRRSWGATDGTRSFFMASELVDDRASAAFGNCACLANTTGVIAEIDEATNALTGLVGFTSWDTNDITVTPSDALAVAMECVVILYAGVSFYVDAFTTPATSADVVRSGAGFTPTAGKICYAVTGSAMGTIGQRGPFSYGCFNASAQWCSFGTREEATSNYTYDMFSTSRVGLYDGVLGGALVDEFTFSAFGAGGGTFVRTTGAAARPVCVIWIAGCSSQVGTVSARTAAAGDGTIDVTTTGFDAKLLTLACNPPTTATETATAEPYEQILGFATGTGATEQATVWFYDVNNETLNGTTNKVDPLLRQDDSFVIRRWNRTGADTIDATSVCEIAVSDMAAGDKAVLTQTEEDVATLIGYMALGDPPTNAVLLHTYYALEGGA